MSASRNFMPKRPPAEVSARQLEKLTEGAKVHESVEVSPTPAQARQAREVAFTLTLDGEVAARIDQLRQKPLKLSRRQWIRTAILEKIERDG